MSNNDLVRVFRIIEYFGPRDQVQEQVKKSLHGSREGVKGVTITATTLGEFPEDVHSEVDNLQVEATRLANLISGSHLEESPIREEQAYEINNAAANVLRIIRERNRG